MVPHPRKRSRSAKLILMVPATTLLLSACSKTPEQPAVVYRDAAECTQAHPEAAAQCQADYDAAKAQHPKVAPKYITQAECEADFGAARCEVIADHRASGGSFFMPMMMGYMAGQMFNRPFMGSMAPGFSQPLYRSYDDRDTFRTASNAPVSNRTGPVTVNPDNFSAAATTGGVRRSGGFGSTAAHLDSSSGG